MQDQSQPHEGSDSITPASSTATLSSSKTVAPNACNALASDSTAGMNRAPTISSGSGRSSGSSSPTSSEDDPNIDYQPMAEGDFTKEEMEEYLGDIPSYFFSTSPAYDPIRADEYLQSLQDQPTSKLSLQSWKELTANFDKLINACAAAAKLPRPESFNELLQEMVDEWKQKQQSAKDKRDFVDKLRDERDSLAMECDSPTRLWISMLEMEVFGTRVVTLTGREEQVLKTILKDDGGAYGIPMEVWDNLRTRVGVDAA